MITSTYVVALEPVTSKAIVARGYDPGAHELHVQFHSGHVTVYYNVPLSIWEAWLQAPSAGSFFGAEVKKQFTGRKVTGNCPQCGDVGLLEHTCTCCGCATYQPNEKAR